MPVGWLLSRLQGSATDMEKEPDVLPPVEDDVETSDVTEPAAAAVASEPVQTEEPIAAEPIAEPVAELVTEPVAAEPIIAAETTEPIAAESIADPVAEPVVATEGNEDIEITLTSGSGTDLASQNTITITAPEGDEKVRPVTHFDFVLKTSLMQAWSRDNNSSPDDILLVSDASQLEKPQVRRARSTTVSGTSTVNEQAEDLTLATVSLSQDDSGIPPLSIKLPTPATTAHSSSSPNSAVSPGGTSTNLSAATAATTATTTASAATLTPNSNSGGGFFSKLTNSIRRNSISAEPPSPLMTTAKMTTSLSREELDIDDVLNMDPEEFRKNSEHHNTLSATNSSISATPTDSPETPTIERRMSSSPSGAPGFDGATSPGAATTKRSSTFKVTNKQTNKQKIIKPLVVGRRSRAPSLAPLAVYLAADQRVCAARLRSRGERTARQRMTHQRRETRRITHRRRLHPSLPRPPKTARSLASWRKSPVFFRQYRRPASLRSPQPCESRSSKTARPPPQTATAHPSRPPEQRLPTFPLRLPRQAPPTRTASPASSAASLSPVAQG